MDPSAVPTVLLGSALVSAVVTSVLTPILSHWNEQSRAREERRQRRLAETYLEVIEQAISARDWVEASLAGKSAGVGTGPDLPTYDKQRLGRVRLSAYGSAGMQTAFREFVSAANAFLAKNRLYKSMTELAAKSPATAGLAERIAQTFAEM